MQNRKRPELFIPLFIFLLCGTALPNPVIANLPVNSWYEVPNSRLDAVAPPGWSANVMVAWCGGAYDTKRDRLIIWGGGHNDYRGNEVYVFNLATLKWIRLSDPSDPYANCGQTNPDGTLLKKDFVNPLFLEVPANLRKVYNALAVYPDGLGPFSGTSGGDGCCTCRSPRFDVDGYGRMFIPSALLAR
jgi:hypothetical protein